MSRGGERGRRLDRASFVPLSQQLYPRLRGLSGRVGTRATLETGRELLETFGVSRATDPEGAPFYYGERHVPMESVEGVSHPARHNYRHRRRRRRIQAGEPDCSVPELSGTELDAGGQR